MKNLALVTVMFEYSEWAMPRIYDNAKKYFEEEDIHICRFSGVDRSESLYEKLYVYKTKYLKNYIRENLLDKYEFMLFVDAKDTNFYKSPHDIVETFLKFNSSIVFGGEVDLWPPHNYTHLYENKLPTGPFKFLNSGTYIGHTSKIYEHLENMDVKDYGIHDDQGVWTVEYLLHDDIQLDFTGELFFSTHRNKHLVSITDSVPTLSISPYVVHDNGPYLEETIKITDML
jgi:hypothetical protein